MPRLLPYLAALLLGVCSALLVACGDDGTRGGIPAASADHLVRDLDAVNDAVESGNCDQIDDTLRRIDIGIDRLPRSDVNERLVQRLRDASDRLHDVAFKDCNAKQRESAPAPTEPEPETQTQTQETTTTTEPPPEEPETEPEEEPEPTEPEEPTTPIIPPGGQTPPDDGDQDDGGIVPGVQP